jgi:hypothetical protein
MRERHPLNAPGDFYVERGQCISCGAPEAEAPMLMAYDEEEGCYFRRQPETEEEVQCAINAILVSCVRPQRYAGTDEKVRIRLSVLGFRDNCDHPIEPAVDPQSHVRFSVAIEPAKVVAEIQDARVLLRRFVGTSSETMTVMMMEGDVAKATAEWRMRGHVLNVFGVERQADEEGASTWLFYNTKGSHLALAHVLQELGATNVLWFSKHEWENQMPGHATQY